MRIKSDKFKFIQGCPAANLIRLTSLVLFVFCSEVPDYLEERFIKVQSSLDFII